MQTPHSTTPAGLALVWSSEPPPRIETVSARRRYFRATTRGGSEPVDIDISLPRVRFLEAQADPAAPFPWEIEGAEGREAAADSAHLAEAA